MPIPPWLQKYQADRNREVQTRNGSYYDPRRGVWVNTASGRPGPEPGLLGPVAGTGSQFRTGPVPAGEGLVTPGPRTAEESAAWYGTPGGAAPMTPWERFQAEMAQMGAVLPGSLGGAGSDPSKLTFTRDVNVRAGGDVERQAREGGPARYFSIAENEAAAQRAAWDRDAEPPGPGLVTDDTPIVTPPADVPPAAVTPTVPTTAFTPTVPPNTYIGPGPITPGTYTPPGGGLLGDVGPTGNPFADESLRLQTVRQMADTSGPPAGGGFPGQFPPQGGGRVVSRVPARPVDPINRYTGPGPIGGGFNRPANLYVGPGGQGRPGYPPQWGGAPPPQPRVPRGLWQQAGGEFGRLEFPEALEGAAWAGGSALASVAAPWAIPAIVAANMEFGPWGAPKPSDAAKAGWDALQNWNSSQAGGGGMQRPQTPGPRGTWQQSQWR